MKEVDSPIKRHYSEKGGHLERSKFNQLLNIMGRFNTASKGDLVQVWQGIREMRRVTKSGK